MVMETIQELRSKATEFLLREEWKESIETYSQLIFLYKSQISCTNSSTPDHLSKLQKSLSLAHSNRAEAHFKLLDVDAALADCDEALKIESSHFKTLFSKGKILLSLNRYSSALDCFSKCTLDSQASGNSESLNGFLEKCKKLEFQSRTGAIDISAWVLSGFKGKSPELAEYIGPVQINKSNISGRGLFATKNIDTGTVILVTKAVASERGILPDWDQNGQIVIWKNFVEKVTKSAESCRRILESIQMLSTGQDEDMLDVPDIGLFRPEAEDSQWSSEKLDKARMLSVLDVNSLVEDVIPAKVLGRNSGYYVVGLWVLASFINHSCNPSARRVHIGDYVIVHASRDIKAGEEITFSYFDVLSPIDKRREMLKAWRFNCNCTRCKFEEALCSRAEIQEIEMGLERGLDAGNAVYRLEEAIKKWMVRGKDKGYVRASFWNAYSEAYRSEKTVRRWGRRIPPKETSVDSVVEAVGNDERILKMMVEQLKKRRGTGGGSETSMEMEMERVMKLGRGVYGKVLKKQAMKTLLEL